MSGRGAELSPYLDDIAEIVKSEGGKVSGMLLGSRLTERLSFDSVSLKEIVKAYGGYEGLDKVLSEVHGIRVLHSHGKQPEFVMSTPPGGSTEALLGVAPPLTIISTAPQNVSVDMGARQRVLAPADACSLIERSPDIFEEESLLDKVRSWAFVGKVCAKIADGRMSLYENPVYLNTSRPFNMVMVAPSRGVSNVVVESCMLETSAVPLDIRAKEDGFLPAPENLLRQDSPHAVCIFHFDQDLGSCSDAATLFTPSMASQRQKSIFVSPLSYYRRRDVYHKSCDCNIGVEIVPLLFRWQDLSPCLLAYFLKAWGTSRDILRLLRQLQRSAEELTFAQFVERCKSEGYCDRSPLLIERLELLEMFLAESESNQYLPKPDIPASLESGSFIADLSDPLLCANDANAIFSVLLSMMHSLQRSASHNQRLVVFEGAEKYLTDCSDDGVLNSLVLETMRNAELGISVVLTVQNPQRLRPDFFDALSVCFIHRFHSREWFSVLQSKVGHQKRLDNRATVLNMSPPPFFRPLQFMLHDNSIIDISSLAEDEALIFTRRVTWGTDGKICASLQMVKMRQRLAGSG
jgi:hypothetical protein